MRRDRFRFLALALAGLPLAAGCAGDDATPLVPEVGGDLFARYVAVGNSLTAGYQSDGLNDSLQVRAWPVLLARKAGAAFEAPLIARPGCPRPFTGPLGIAAFGFGRLGASESCVRINTPRIINNVAVPGSDIGDVIHMPRDPAELALHRLMIGNRSQLQAMQAADPTLVTVWVGNNDALQPALRGDVRLLTPEALFAARVDTVAAAIRQANPRGVVLLGVVNAAAFAPLLQPGAFYYLAWAGAAAQGQPSPFGRPVSADCAPGTPGSRNLVSLAVLGTSPTQVPVISCAEDAPLVLSQAEAAVVTARVNAFNARLEAVAQQNGWIFFNSNAVFVPLAQDPNRIRRCQGLAALTPASTPQQIGAAIAGTCPNLRDRSIGFGSVISFDGVHPSNAGHAFMADAVAAALNERFGISLPTS